MIPVYFRFILLEEDLNFVTIEIFDEEAYSIASSNYIGKNTKTFQCVL